MGYYIKDADGWWVGMRRNSEKAPIHLWSEKRDQKGEMHFIEVANKISSIIPQPTQIKFYKG